MFPKFQIGRRQVDTEKEIAELEIEMKLGAGYFSQLIQQDDFTFFVRLTAIVEAVVNDTLSARIRVPGADVRDPGDAVSNFLARLPMQGKIGKLELLRSLGLVGDRHYRACTSLLRIRNLYVHNVANMPRNLSEIVGSAELFQILAGLGVKPSDLGTVEGLQIAFGIKLGLLVHIGQMISVCRVRRVPYSLLDAISPIVEK